MKLVKYLFVLLVIYLSTYEVDSQGGTLSLAFSPQLAALTALGALALGGLGLAAALAGQGGGGNQNKKPYGGYSGGGGGGYGGGHGGKKKNYPILIWRENSNEQLFNSRRRRLRWRRTWR